MYAAKKWKGEEGRWEHWILTAGSLPFSTNSKYTMPDIRKHNLAWVLPAVCMYVQNVHYRLDTDWCPSVLHWKWYTFGYHILVDIMDARKAILHGKLQLTLCAPLMASMFLASLRKNCSCSIWSRCCFWFSHTCWSWPLSRFRSDSWLRICSSEVLFVEIKG